MFDLREAFGWLSAGRLIGDGAIRVAGVSTDTRRIAAGDLFVAIRGERFDAHQFAPQARRAGAAAIVVERWVEGLAGPALMVSDSRHALGELAAGWRRRFALPVIAVTGSNGKTTVKEMIAAVLAAHFGEAHRLATAGNFNNDVGVPLSVFRLRDSHQAAVFELGMNRPGEIGWLSTIAQPTVALVNNAQREHQEFMASVEATALENGAVLASLPADGVAVFPGDDANTPIWRTLAGARRCIEFGLGPAPAVSASPDARPEAFSLNLPGGPVTVQLAIAGVHNVRNALAAAASCHALGIDAATIARGLAAFRPVGGRLVRNPLPGGATLIDDSYNANPDSMHAAIEVLADLPGPRLLVMGDMGEVGNQGPQFHGEAGRHAGARGIEKFFTLGEQSQEAAAAFGGGRHFSDMAELVAAVVAELPQVGSVLVKGSRFMKMERVVQAVMAAADQTPQHEEERHAS